MGPKRPHGLGDFVIALKRARTRPHMPWQRHIVPMIQLGVNQVLTRLLPNLYTYVMKTTTTQQSLLKVSMHGCVHLP